MQIAKITMTGNVECRDYLGKLRAEIPIGLHRDAWSIAEMTASELRKHKAMAGIGEGVTGALSQSLNKPQKIETNKFVIQMPIYAYYLSYLSTPTRWVKRSLTSPKPQLAAWQAMKWGEAASFYSAPMILHRHEFIQSALNSVRQRMIDILKTGNVMKSLKKGKVIK